MNMRSMIIMVVAILCAAALWGVVAQGRQLSTLRDEQKRLSTSNQLAESNASKATANPSPTPEVPRELLQLRAEVARLSQQQRELSGARHENERLRLQLENRRTNSAAAGKLNGAYIRTSQAQWLGYNTPEDTLQSMFWAVKNRNLEKFLESATPEASEEFRKQISLSDNPATAAEEFFKSEQSPPGFKVIGREQIADDTIGLRIQFVMPDGSVEPRIAVDSSELLQFKRIAGQWKLSKNH
jgi:hypothetical protein